MLINTTSKSYIKTFIKTQRRNPISEKEIINLAWNFFDFELQFCVWWSWIKYNNYNVAWQVLHDGMFFFIFLCVMQL